jgi:adenylate kinase
MKYRSILLFGAPGSGKGTQGKILGSIPGYYHCSTGALFRSLRPETELGRVFLEYSSAGRLVPDEFTVRLWREHMSAECGTGRFHPETDPLLLDGIPRNVPQANLLANDIDVIAIIHLEASENTKLVHRMQRRALKENRLDDASLTTIRHRFDVYATESRAVLNSFESRLVHPVDAAQSPLHILRNILDILDPLQPQAARAL